ncbi:MAG: hypothetical protein H6626_03170 [Pseudobdellovibrionaceae bacterium]|nr:MAG: hypothetical protein H6626_03170 [Pseudobdellovibrionaceae bacterium]
MGQHKRKPIKQALASVLSLGVASLLVMFNNCTAEHEGFDEAKFQSSLGSGKCSITSEQQLFSYTYHPFLEENCAACHVPGGIGKGGFATSGLQVAWQAFSAVGFSKVSAFAVDAAHQSPYTGPHQESKVNELKDLWAKGQEELVRCQGVDSISEFVDDPWEDVRVHSISKAINPSLEDEVTLRWDLNNEMRNPPDGVTWPELPGAFFEIAVRIQVQSTSTAYYISKPRIIYPAQNANATDITLKSIRFKINGEDVVNETTYHFIEASARKNQSTLLSAGTMVAVGTLRASDVLSFSIGEIAAVTLPPPPPGPTASFELATTTLSTEAGTSDCPNDSEGNPLVTNGDKCVYAKVVLSRPIDTFSAVGFSIDNGGTTARVPCCSQIIDINDETTEVRNYDRDFDIVGNGSFTLRFDPTETEKSIAIRIINDQRDDAANETITLRLDDFLIASGENGSIAGQSTHIVNIPDNDAAPGAFEVTLTDLMKPNGAFDRFCVRCHHRNSADQLGREYDMTTYEDLISLNRFKPGDLDNSKSWRRILGLDGKEPMPKGGILNLDGGDTAREDIRQWILSGAKNN